MSNLDALHILFLTWFSIYLKPAAVKMVVKQPSQHCSIPDLPHTRANGFKRCKEVAGQICLALPVLSISAQSNDPLPSCRLTHSLSRIFRCFKLRSVIATHSRYYWIPCNGLQELHTAVGYQQFTLQNLMESNRNKTCSFFLTHYYLMARISFLFVRVNYKQKNPIKCTSAVQTIVCTSILVTTSKLPVTFQQALPATALCAHADSIAVGIAQRSIGPEPTP